MKHQQQHEYRKEVKMERDQFEETKKQQILEKINETDYKV